MIYGNVIDNIIGNDKDITALDILTKAGGVNVSYFEWY